jgi:hypothetical protein
VRPARRLVLIVVFAALAVRLWGLGFGLPFGYARPDETMIAGPAVGFLSGDFTPPDYRYPTFLMYVVAFVYAVYYVVSRPFTGVPTLAAFAESRYQSLGTFFYLARGLSALMGALTVWWIHAICRLVFDETVGVVAALFLAVSFLHVRDSHFGVTDITMTGLIVLAVLAIIRWQRARDTRGAAWAGLVGGLAMSTKYNGLGVCVPFAVAVAQHLVEAGRTFRAEVRTSARAIVAFGAVFVIAFLVGSPYIVIEWHRFLNDVTIQGTATLQGHGIAMSRGWLYHARVTLPAALGWPIYVAGVTGMAGLLVTRFRQSAVLLAFPIAYYVVAGSGYAVFARYMIPVLPFLCIAAAWLAVVVVRTVAGAGAPWLQQLALAVVALGMAAPSARQVWLLDRLFARTDNRVVVARALANLIPPGSLVYHSGGRYGHVPFDLPREQLVLKECEYDEETGRFMPEDRPPDWIILQRSPLVLYSYVPPNLDRLVRRTYALAGVFSAGTPGPDRTYDQQDAFFLPLGHLEGIRRLGPDFEIYRRR